MTISLLILCVLAGDSPTAGQVYERVVRATIDRAQADLWRGLDLHPDHSRWEDPWEVKTDHYRVRTTVSRFLAVDTARGLEQMLLHFQELLRTSAAPAEPFTILIFPTLQEYNQLGQKYGTHSSLYGSFYVPEEADRPVATFYTSNATLLRMWITHSATHQYLAHAFPDHSVPAWVEEGLASYFALFWDYRFGVQDLQRIKQQRKVLPLRNLLGSPLENYVDDAENRFTELAMLFTYLLRFREDTRIQLDDRGDRVAAPFAEYLESVLRGQPVRDGAIDHLLRDGLDDLEKDFRAFTFPS